MYRLLNALPIMESRLTYLAPLGTCSQCDIIQEFMAIVKAVDRNPIFNVLQEFMSIVKAVG